MDISGGTFFAASLREYKTGKFLLLKSINIMVRTQVLYSNFCVPWLSFPPPICLWIVSLIGYDDMTARFNFLHKLLQIFIIILNFIWSEHGLNSLLLEGITCFYVCLNNDSVMSRKNEEKFKKAQ